jgi:chromatin assembly factor 1 subunit A
MSVPETMEDQPQVVLAQPQKRPLDDEDAAMPSTPKKAAPPSDAGSSPLTVLSTVASPSPHKISKAVETGLSASSNAQPPAKKRKLTPQEKEAQKLEKDTKAKAREEKKAQKELEDKLKAQKKAEKDEQKRVKDEEKRVKDEEKRKKAEEREEKKRAKEMEQLQKEEEQRKKERVCYPLAFFYT